MTEASSRADGAEWLSPAPAPRRIIDADDTLTADAAFRLVAEGTALRWRSDYQNARQLLQALGRRLDKREPHAAKGSRKTGAAQGSAPSRDAAANAKAPDPAAFHRYRMQQAQRARVLGQVLIPLDPGFVIPLRRAPDVAAACTHALGRALHGPALLPLRELLGMIGAYEWFRQGVPVAALGATIHPHYGVFAPVRGEYVELVAQTPLPAGATRAIDLGSGTGVLAAVLARRGLAKVIACDNAPQALACAADNLQRLGLAERVSVTAADLYPAVEPVDLVVCNPPWLPGKASSSLEAAVYDPDSHLLRGFLAGLSRQLTAHGEGWLILSDLAEHLGLRSRAQLLAWIADAGLAVAGRHDTRPQHKRAHDSDDLFHAARSREVTSLWRLQRAAP